MWNSQGVRCDYKAARTLSKHRFSCLLALLTLVIKSTRSGPAFE